MRQGAATTLPARAAYLIGAAWGAGGWLAVSRASGRREAWDSDLYFSWFFPSTLVAVAVLAFFAPERFWRWAFVPFAAQAAVAFVQAPSASLLPLGLAVFAFYGAVCLVPAWAGAALRRRLDRARAGRSKATD